jgi:hypothetical protein
MVTAGATGERVGAGGGTGVAGGGLATRLEGGEAGVDVVRFHDPIVREEPQRLL